MANEFQDLRREEHMLPGTIIKRVLRGVVAERRRIAPTLRPTRTGVRRPRPVQAVYGSRSGVERISKPDIELLFYVTMAPEAHHLSFRRSVLFRLRSRGLETSNLFCVRRFL